MRLGANAGSVAFRWTGCDQNPGAASRGALERIHSNRVPGGRGSAPRPRPTAPRKERWVNRVSGTGRSCADRAPATMHGKETGPVAEQKQLI